MKRIMYREAIASALAEEMRRDEKVFVMGEDVAIIGGVYKATRGLLEEFGPTRVRNTPLSELAIAGVATGAAMCGARPVAEIMHIDFVGCGFDIFLNQMSKMCYKTNGKIHVPLVIRTQGGRGHSNGCTQSQSLEALFTHIPGLKVVMPSTPYDAKGLLKTAIRDENPVIFIEHKGLYQTKGEVPEEEYLIPLGKADVKRYGKDVTIISYSKTVRTALEAASILEQQGIDAEVLDLRTLVPLDFDAIAESVKKTGRVIITHEACERTGYGAEIAAEITEKLFDELDAPIVRVCGANIPVPNATLPEQASAPTAEKLVQAALNICQGVRENG
jgi:pyruvate/2-oxoglutarate/acetoin dehydrogenase E1 component